MVTHHQLGQMLVKFLAGHVQPRGRAQRPGGGCTCAEIRWPRWSNLCLSADRNWDIGEAIVDPFFWKNRENPMILSVDSNMDFNLDFYLFVDLSMDFQLEYGRRVEYLHGIVLHSKKTWAWKVSFRRKTKIFSKNLCSSWSPKCNVLNVAKPIILKHPQ